MLLLNTIGVTPYSVVGSDVNGDGKLDLVCVNADANMLTVLTNNGSGGFVTAGTVAVSGEPFCVVAADVNGDGKPDLITADAGIVH